jgi:hypothetical protein
MMTAALRSMLAHMKLHRPLGEVYSPFKLTPLTLGAWSAAHAPSLQHHSPQPVACGLPKSIAAHAENTPLSCWISVSPMDHQCKGEVSCGVAPPYSHVRTLNFLESM